MTLEGSTTSAHAAPEPRIGDVIGGKYRIESLLGRGGMGAVYAARHEHLGHRVALKLPVHARSPGAIPRFLREARAAAAIESENVARVFDAGERAPGEPYLVMELLSGEDLAAVLRARGPLPPEEAVGCLLQAGAGLAAAHARGIVHRDLKPANLFLARRSDGTSRVLVLDFGISKLRGSIESGHAAGPELEGETLTQTGRLLGSPRYMSPEQMSGGTEEVGERADLWALGAILHELLCGQPAFAGRSFEELRRRITREPPRSVRLDRPEISPDLEAILLRCLDRQPARRFPDVAALLDALVPFGPADAAGYAARARSELSHRTTAGSLDAAATSPDAPPEPERSLLPPAERSTAAATETSPPVSHNPYSGNEAPEITSPAPAPRRAAVGRTGKGLTLLLLLLPLLAFAAWRIARQPGPGGDGWGRAELARAQRLRADHDLAAARRALQALLDRALAEGVAPGSPAGSVAAAAALALAEVASEELVVPPAATSLETYLVPADTLARQTQEGMRLYGAVIPWNDAAVMQCAIVGQARLHERHGDLLRALPAPPERTGPVERGAWSREAALAAYRTGAEAALEMALELHDNALLRPVPGGGGCREEASRGRARVSAKLGR